MSKSIHRLATEEMVYDKVCVPYFTSGSQSQRNHRIANESMPERKVCMY